MMNTPTRICRRHLVLLFTAVLLVSLRAWTKVEYDSEQLKMKNTDQINEIVKQKILKAQAIQAKQEDDDDGGIKAEPAAIEQLKDGMRIVLSRPDQDGTRGPAFTRLRRELTDLGSLDSVLSELTDESIDALKDSKTEVREQSTYVVLLGNLMAELKPEVGSMPPFKKIIEKIRDADIQISDQAKLQARLRSMSRVVSPSDTAAQIVPKKK